MKINGNPDGGGGGSAVINSLNVTSNGIYTAGGGVDGYSPVEVSVPSPEFVTEPLYATANGEYTPGQGVDGYSIVSVSVPISGNLDKINITSNGSYFASDYQLDGWKNVYVNVPEGDGTWSRPYGIQDAISVISESPEGTSSMYVRAFVTQISSAYSQTGTYGNADFYVGSSVSGGNWMRAYRLNYFDGNKYNSYPDYASRPDIQIGDEVIMYGQFRLYNNSPQTIAGNTYLYALNGVYGVEPDPSLEMSIYSNGTYDVTYYGSVNVSVPSREFITETLNASVNGTYTPGQGVDGFSQVVVDVPQSGTGFTQKEITEGVQITNLSNSASFVSSGVFVYNSYITEVVLPSCTIVYSEGFRQCINLSYVSLPMCISLGYSAGGTITDNMCFTSCRSLSYVSLPVCKTIGASCFKDCINLRSIDLPVCDWISPTAFQGCTRLSIVSLYVCSFIGNSAFQSCTSISEFWIYNSSICPSIGSKTFSNTSCLFYVPSSLVDIYKSAQYWSEYSSRIFPISE